MRRIDTPTAAQDLFGPGKHGFRNGDPANAVLATRLNAEHFNAVQEEIAGVIEGSGTALNPADNGQLFTAIKSLFRSATLKATELLLGVLRVGTQAEVDAGTLDDVAVTPKKLRWGFTASWGTNGYIVFPSWLMGFILQWGTVVTDANGLAVFTHTLAFPNFAFNPICSVGATMRVVASWVVETSTLTSTRAWVSTSSGTAFASSSVRFLILGR